MGSLEPAGSKKNLKGGTTMLNGTDLLNQYNVVLNGVTAALPDAIRGMNIIRLQDALRRSGPKLVFELRQCLCNIVSFCFATWQEWKIGDMTSAEVLGTVFKKHKHQLSPWAEEALNSICYINPPGVIKLVRISLSELGFGRGATQKQIYARAKEFSLFECPQVVAPGLRIGYDEEQPLGECLHIATSPIKFSKYGPHLFIVLRDEAGSWLRGTSAGPRRVFGPETIWVFKRES